MFAEKQFLETYNMCLYVFEEKSHVAKIVCHKKTTPQKKVPHVGENWYSIGIGLVFDWSLHMTFLKTHFVSKQFSDMGSSLMTHLIV